MSEFVAALLMYDWPERRAEVDAEWAALHDRLRASGIDAPQQLVRRNADMPAVPGGIRNAEGRRIAPDPATLPPDEMDFHVLWRHPNLLFAQTCWGPMELGLAGEVEVLGQPDYSGMEGGRGPLYSSAVVVRKGEAERVAAPSAGMPVLPLELLRGRRLAYNSTDSMSGLIGLTKDLAVVGESLDLFGERIESGGHRNSIAMIARGDADVATIDARSWALALKYEPAAADVVPVGWTALRNGLPFITARKQAPLRPILREALQDLLMVV